MDSQDSAAAHHHHHLLHHHHHNHYPQPLPPSHHHPQTQPQRFPPPSNSYPQQLPNTNNSLAPTTSNNAMFPFNSMAASSSAQKPLDQQFADGSPPGSGSAWLNTEPAKKKRGRPRKYSPDNSIGLGLSPVPPVNQISTSAARVDSGGVGAVVSSETAKRHRGRPPGSVKRQMDALGVAGVGFTPHVITAESGEDVAAKLMAFSEEGPRTVCILSAHGAISNVTLRQPATSWGTVTYEGRFEIISLSGSFSESCDQQSQTGCSLSVSLAGSDGRVLGGGVAGMLKAASPVQIVVGSFISQEKKSKGDQPPSIPDFGAPVSPPSPGDSSESPEENDGSPTPLDRRGSGSGPFLNAGQPMMYPPGMGWPNSIKMHPN